MNKVFNALTINCHHYLAMSHVFFAYLLYQFFVSSFNEDLFKSFTIQRMNIYALLKYKYSTQSFDCI